MGIWFFGLFVSLVIGHVVTATLLVQLRIYVEKREDEFRKNHKYQKLRFYLGIDIYPPDDSTEERPVHPALIGFAERLFFTIIVAFNLGGAAVAMVAWIALKMVAARPHRKERAQRLRNGKNSTEAPALGFEFAGLFGNLMSMFFSLIGGLLIFHL